MNENRNDTIEIDIKEILMLLWQKVGFILAFTVVTTLLTGLISIYAITPQYSATSKIYILTNSDSMVNLGDLQLGSSLASDYTEIIRIRPVLEKVAKNLKLEISYEELLECVSITNPEDTRILNINVTYPDPVLAKKLADEVSLVARKQIVEIMHAEEPTVVEAAVIPEHQSSPNNIKNICLGFILGLVLSASFIVIVYIMDDTIQNGDDVEKYLGLNLLGSIPEEGGTDNSEKKDKKKRRMGIRKGSL